VSTHGVRSIHTPGRQRVPEALETLGERIAAEGGASHGAVSLRQLSADLSGLAQGFDSWSAQHVSESGAPSDAASSLAALVDASAADLAGDGNLALFLQLSLLRPDAPTPLLVEAQLDAALGEHRDSVEGLSAALDDDELQPEERVAAVERVLARRRGSAIWDDYERAVDAARMARLEEVLLELVELLARHGRAARADVLLVGTPTGELAGPFARLRSRGDGADSAEARRLAELELQVRAAPADLELAWTPLEGADIELELRGEGLVLRGAEEDSGPSLRPSEGGRALIANLAGEALHARIDAERTRASYLLKLRGVAEHEGLHSAQVLIGTQLVADTALPRVPDPLGELWEPELEAGAVLPWIVDVQRPPGGAFELSVGQTHEPRDVRLLLARYPESASTLIEVSATSVFGEEPRVVPIPGRGDAVWIEGRWPFSIRAELGSDARPSLAVMTSAGCVPVTDMRYRARRWTRDGLVLMLPSWMAGVSDPMWRMDAQLEDEPGTLTLWRPGGWNTSLDVAPSPEDQLFLRRLYPRE